MERYSKGAGLKVVTLLRENLIFQDSLAALAQTRFPGISDIKGMTGGFKITEGEYEYKAVAVF